MQFKLSAKPFNRSLVRFKSLAEPSKNSIPSGKRSTSIWQALEQWREITQERQQVLGEYLVETRERVQALEQRRDEAPYDPKEDDQPVGKTLLSPQHLGQVYVLARQERRRSGQAVSALLAALAQAFGVPDISDLPESAWDDVLGWFWERRRRG